MERDLLSNGERLRTRFESKMPTVRIDLLEGRTPEQKKRLAQAITEDIVRILGVDKERVNVIFNNLAKHDLARGGVPATEWK